MLFAIQKADWWLRHQRMPESSGHTGRLRGLRHGWDRLQSFSVLSGFMAKINWKAKDKGGKFVEKNVFVTNIQVNKWQHASPLIIIYKVHILVCMRLSSCFQGVYIRWVPRTPRQRRINDRKQDAVYQAAGGRRGELWESKLNSGVSRGPSRVTQERHKPRGVPRDTRGAV